MDADIQLHAKNGQLNSLETEGRWFLEHYEAEACYKYGLFVCSVNTFLKGVFDVDLELRVRDDYSEKTAKALDVLFFKSYQLSQTALHLTRWFENKGHVVDEAGQLRKWHRELEAISRPDDAMPDWLAKQQEEADREQRLGKTLVGWAD